MNSINPKQVLVFGITSPMTKEAALALASRGYSIIGVARPGSDVSMFKNSDINFEYIDASDSLEKRVQDFALLTSKYENIVGVVMAWGAMPELLGSDSSLEQVEKLAYSIEINFSAPASTLLWFANYFESQLKQGFIAGISSVAGDRGRGSNFIYGSPKAGFTAFLSGLRSRYSKSGIHVLTIKPGFVASRMTEGKDFPLPVATAHAVGCDIASAIIKRKDLIYTPFWWRLVMSVIKHIPEAIFKKMKF